MMNWYYAVGEERKGPVSEEDFQRLVQQGVIASNTLIWRDGLANWQPYGVGLTPPMAGSATAGSVVCANCRGTFPESEIISLVGNSYCTGCKPVVLGRLKESGTGSPAAEQMRKDHLKHEASIKSVGTLYLIGSAVWFFAGIVSLVLLSDGKEPLEAIGIAVVLFLLGVAQVWTGLGLRRLQKWARVPTGIMSGIGLLGIPIGTIINGYILYLVFSQKGKTVLSDEYLAVIAQTPHIKYRTSIVVWIVLGLFLLFIAAVIIAAVLGRH